MSRLIHGDYLFVPEVPTVSDYRRLRDMAGLTPRSAEASAAGLPNTIAGVTISRNGRVVGMGRVIGDGGLVFQVVDIAVEPEHQGRGLGKAIVGALMDQLRALAPGEAYVSLIANGDAHRLYAQFGFEPTAPASIGMAMWMR